jgi:ribonuclease VapC
VIVLDSSALLATFFEEPGYQQVDAALPESMMSVVNVAETLTRLVRDGRDAEAMAARLATVGISFEPFDWAQVIVAAKIEPSTRHLGLSLGDRACLALAIARDLPVLTADRAWARLDLGVEVRLIR